MVLSNNGSAESSTIKGPTHRARLCICDYQLELGSSAQTNEPAMVCREWKGKKKAKFLSERTGYMFIFPKKLDIKTLNR